MTQQQQGMLNLPLALGLGILSSQRPTRYPQNFFSSIGPGVARGVQMYAAGRPKPIDPYKQLQIQQLQMQLETKKTETARRQAWLDENRGNYGGLVEAIEAGVPGAKEAMSSRLNPKAPGMQAVYDSKTGQHSWIDKSLIGTPGYEHLLPAAAAPKTPQTVVTGPDNRQPVQKADGSWMFPGPDGTWVDQYGASVMMDRLGGTDVSSAARSDAEKKTPGLASQSDDLTSMLGRVESVKDIFTYEGQVRQKWLRARAKADGPVTGDLLRAIGLDPSLTKEDKQWLQSTRIVEEAVESFFNAYRKEITGAAASVPELERLQDAMLNMNLTWPEFQVSAQRAAEKLKAALEIKNRMVGARSLTMLTAQERRDVDEAMAAALRGDGADASTTMEGLPPDPLDTPGAREQELEELRKQGNVTRW